MSKKCNPKHVERSRFTKLVVGLTQFSFILEVVIKVHFHNYLTSYPKLIENISDDMDADDLTSVGNSRESRNS